MRRFWRCLLTLICDHGMTPQGARCPTCTARMVDDPIDRWLMRISW